MSMPEEEVPISVVFYVGFFALMLGGALGCLTGDALARGTERARAKEAKVGRYVVDQTTDAVTFEYGVEP